MHMHVPSKRYDVLTLTRDRADIFANVGEDPVKAQGDNMAVIRATVRLNRRTTAGDRQAGVVGGSH